MTSDASDYPFLELSDEIKIRKLLGREKVGDRRLEASGVVYRNDCFYVVFDNFSQVARIQPRLLRIESSLLGREEDFGYEGITYNSRDKVFYTVIESKEDGTDRAVIHQYDDQFQSPPEECILEGDFDFTRDNKGFEGLSYVFKGNENYLLALCEGNDCRGGKAGRKRDPGKGRIQVFRQEDGCWKHCQTVNLPDTVKFIDYSGLDTLDGRIAVTSQESSLLWISTFEDSWTISDPGQIYRFPIHEKRKSRGKQKYCNVEGVSWINTREIVVVSDRAKKGQRIRCKKRDQSIHIFRIPDS